MSQTYDWKKTLLSEAPMNLGPSQVLALQVHTSELLDEVEKLLFSNKQLINILEEIRHQADQHEDSLSSSWLIRVANSGIEQYGGEK